MEQSTFCLGNLLHNDILRKGLLEMPDASAPSHPSEEKSLWECNVRARRPNGKMNLIASVLVRYKVCILRVTRRESIIGR